MNPEDPSSSAGPRRRLIGSRSSSSLLSSGSRGSVDSSFASSSISSPVTDLTFDLQVLSTHGKEKTKLARRKLSLNLSAFDESPESSSLSFLQRSISTDEGCYVDSPDSSHSCESMVYDSPFLDNMIVSSSSSSSSSSLEQKTGLREYFRRHSSVPASSFSACGLTSVGEVLSSHSAENVSRYTDEENKENEIGGRGSECKKSVSFKLPTSPTPRGIISPFKFETNRPTSGKQSSVPGNCTSQDLEYKSPKTPAKAPGRQTQRIFSRKSSHDDGFLKGLEMEEESIESIAVPKGLEGLFFSPVIEGNETETSPIVHERASSKTCDGKEEVAPPGGGLFHSPSRPRLIRRKYSAQDIRISYKRSESLSQDLTPLQLKRWKGLTKEKDVRTKEDVTEKQVTPRRIMRCHSETEIFIKKALSWSDTQQNLIGDFSKPFCLPLVNGKHQDLKAISPETMAAIINDVYKDVIENCFIVDCRFPYEFVGGHIRGARNIYTTEDLVNAFFPDSTLSSSSSSSKLTYGTISTDSNDFSAMLSSASDVHEKRTILVFHCEFSSERGPKLSRFLRNRDRDTNSYPSLSYPEIYLLEGGYKAFYESFPNLCQPQSYVPMLQQDHLAELKMYRSKANSWSIAEKARVVGRSTAAHPSLNL